jgi:hypoxanthine phosphoribosyltransferase
LTASVLLDRAAIAAQVTRLGGEIARDHPDGVVLVGVLKGALLFVADLARAIPDIDVTVDFMSISRFAPDSGRVKILHDLGTDIGGRDVVLVEDIVDTGLTLHYLQELLRARAPKSLKTACLLSKPSRRKVEVQVDYIGFTIEDYFVVGYGLDYAEKYRNLPHIAVLEQ